MSEYQVMYTGVFKIFIMQVKAFGKSFKKAKCVSITIASSNINKVIRAILDFFIQTFYKHKKHKMLTSKQK